MPVMKVRNVRMSVGMSVRVSNRGGTGVVIMPVVPVVVPVAVGVGRRFVRVVVRRVRGQQQRQAPGHENARSELNGFHRLVKKTP